VRIQSCVNAPCWTVTVHTVQSDAAKPTRVVIWDNHALRLNAHQVC